MNRRITVIAVVCVLATAALAVFVVGQRDQPERCRATDGCVAGFTVDLAELGLIDPELAMSALAARNPSDGILIAVEGRRSEDSERSDRIVVVAVSAETGSVERVLLDRAGRNAVVDAFVLSPDGMLVGVALVLVEDDGSVSRDAVVIDRATGDTVSVAALSEQTRRCLFTFSADNSRFECGGIAYEVASGARLGGTEDFDPIDIESRWVRMGFRTAAGVQGDPDRYGSEIRLRVDGDERTFLTAEASVENPSRGELSFRPDGEVLIHHRQSLGAGGAEIVLYRTDDATVLRRIERNKPVHDVAWLGVDRLVTVTSDFEIVIYEIT